jgi:hypothetical protein
VVEGPIRAGGQNEGEHPIEIIKDISCSNSQSVETCLGKDSVALGIAARVVAHRMRFAIYLDYQTAL